MPAEQVVLLTTHRNDEGPESLAFTIQHQNTPQSLPVFTLVNDHAFCEIGSTLMIVRMHSPPSPYHSRTTLPDCPECRVAKAV